MHPTLKCWVILEAVAATAAAVFVGDPPLLREAKCYPFLNCWDGTLAYNCEISWFPWTKGWKVAIFFGSHHPQEIPLLQYFQLHLVKYLVAKYDAKLSDILSCVVMWGMTFMWISTVQASSIFGDVMRLQMTGHFIFLFDWRREDKQIKQLPKENQHDCFLVLLLTLLISCILGRLGSKYLLKRYVEH